MGLAMVRVLSVYLPSSKAHIEGLRTYMYMILIPLAKIIPFSSLEGEEFLWLFPIDANDTGSLEAPLTTIDDLIGFQCALAYFLKARQIQ